MINLNKVLVFGATGAQGSPVVRGLLEKGVAVRAVSRDAEKVKNLYGGAVETANADLSDFAALKMAFEGVDAAFFHLPIPRDVREIPTHLGNVLRAAAESDLPRLVFTTSGTTLDALPPIAFVEGNRAAARAVLSSDVPAVVLRPTIYLENLQQPHVLAELHERGTLSYPPLAPNRRVSWTALDDQARLAIAALTAENAVGKTFDIASPEPVTGDELARLLSETIGREIRFTPPTPKQFGETIAAAYGAEAGQGIAELYAATDALPENGAVVELDEVLKILPVKLTPVSEWIRLNFGTEKSFNA